MNNICCTIVTPSHIYKGLTTLNSIRRHDSDVKLFLMLTEPVSIHLDDIDVLYVKDIIKHDEDGKKITEIYAYYPDCMRWSLKPVIMRYLLKQFPESNVIYCDCDLCFYNKPTHLYDYIEKGGIVLTPMWRPTDPAPDLGEFRASFTDGFFNAGCVTANTKGLVALDWWTKVCMSGCEINAKKGMFLDQRYLDLLLLYFPQTVVCQHKGYNVADWNVQIRNEFLDSNQDLKELFEVILIHFTGNTIKRIENGGDPMLEPYLLQYKKYLNESLKILDEIKL
jgi:lipopolysaccharide biosynthesis glycosyltransferase